MEPLEIVTHIWEAWTEVDLDRTMELPVRGTFEVADGLIMAWRDYVDLNRFTTQLA